MAKAIQLCFFCFSMKLKNNALFIADSHYNKQRTVLLDLLMDIESGKVKTEQLILMGDIFDFLSSYVPYFVKINKTVIDLINKISENIEVIYFEGNHDFLLERTFPNAKVYKREQQPVFIEHEGKSIALSHGDIFTPFGYNLYTYVLRTKWLLKFLNIFDINNIITKKIDKALMNKEICSSYEGFNDKIEQRLKLYKADLVIEGHFHQNVLNENYINLPSLFCDRQYVIYKQRRFILVSI